MIKLLKRIFSGTNARIKQKQIHSEPPDTEDYSGEAGSTEPAGITASSDWRARHASMKRKVGMAPAGTTQYQRNAAKVLSVHAGPNMKQGTRAKLQSLAQSSDPETRRTARDALGRS